MDCTTCDGSGEITVEEGPAWWRGSGVYVESYPCRDCEGTGEGLEEEPGPLCKHSQGPECLDCTG